MSTKNHSTMADLAIFTGIVSATILVLRQSQKKSSSTQTAIQVSQLNVYPIKSCGEISVQVAHTTPTGFEYDRVAQVVEEDTGMYCTPRTPKYAKLFHIRPQLDVKTQMLTLEATGVPSLEIDLSHARTTPVQAQAMGDVPVQVEDLGDGATSWLQQVLEVSSNNCRLVKIGSQYKRHVAVNPDQKEPLPTSTTTPPVVSLADEAPYLLTTEVSLQDLNQHLRQRSQDPVDMKRFRPNIVVGGSSSSGTLKAWEEDTWKKIRIANVEFWVWQRCGRCTMTTIDRETLKRGPEPLATLSTFREREHGQRNFGVHLIPVDPSLGSSRSPIQLGDTLEVLEYDAERLLEWKKLHGSP